MPIILSESGNVYVLDSRSDIYSTFARDRFAFYAAFGLFAVGKKKEVILVAAVPPCPNKIRPAALFDYFADLRLRSA